MANVKGPKLSKGTKTTIATTVLSLVMLTGGIAIGCNSEAIYQGVGDMFGYEHIIEDKTEDKTEEVEDEVTGEEGSGDENGAE